MSEYILSRARMEIFAFLELHGYSRNTFKSYRIALDNIETFFRNINVIHYDSKTMMSFRGYAEERRASGDLGRNFYHTFIRTSHYVDNCYNGRMLTGIPSKNPVSSKSSFEDLSCPQLVSCRYMSFVDEFLASSDYGPQVKQSVRAILSIYMDFLEKDEWTPLLNITIDQMARFMICHKSHPSVLKKWMSYVKAFMIFMEERDLAESIPSSFIYMNNKGTKPVLPCYSSDDISRIFASIDRRTNRGKLEFALIATALFTGLRGVDVCNLKLEDLDFDKHELTIQQQKTKAFMSLPMVPLLEEALMDYIMNSRPHSNFHKVFLSPSGQALSSLNRILAEILGKAGLATGKKYGHTFHAFRRCLALWLIETESPPEMISMILGHTDPRAFRRYIPLSLDSLSECCLSLEDIPCKKEVLNGQLYI